MAKYQITAPDGSKYEITAPDDASQADVLAYAQKQHGAGADGGKPSVGQKLRSEVSGLTQSLYDLPQSVVEIGARGLDATGLTNKAYENIHSAFQQGNTDAAEISGADPNSGFYKGGRIVGQLGVTAPVAALAPLKAAGLAGKGFGLFGRMADSALQGGAVSAGTSNASDDPLSQQVGMGAALGSVLPLAKGALSKVISPSVDPAVRKLMGSGIATTLGQTLGGAARTAENKLTSLPIIGSAVRRAQDRGTVGLNRAALNRALAPVKEVLPDNVPVGREAVDYVATKLGDKYDNLLPSLSATSDPQFVNDMQSIIADAQNKLPKPQYEQFRKIITSQVSGKAGAGNTFDGPTLQGINSELGMTSTGYKADPSFDNRQLGHMIGSVKDAVSDLVSRSNPSKSDDLKALNKAWANFSRVRDAAGRIGAKDGVFSAPQLSSAVRAGDKSVGKGAYAKGKALMQDLSDPANLVLPPNVPNSGTADRLLLTEMLRHPAMAIPGLFGSAFYSRPGQFLARQAVANRPSWAPPLAQMIDKKGQFIGLPLTGVLSGGPAGTAYKISQDN